jgi:SAM-dependent methyltransferase
MKLEQNIKNKISEILDSKEFMFNLYEGLDDKKRQELGQFYTPAKICIEMIEKFKTADFSNNDILDPCCGSGNLLIAMLIAGADSQRLFGNDYDNDAVKLCVKRLNRAIELLNECNWLNINNRPLLGDKQYQIHCGNAVHEFALTYFGEDYDKLYNAKGYHRVNHKNLLHIDDPNYDAYEESAFKTLYPEIYLKVCNNRLEQQKAKRDRELKDIKDTYDEDDLSFLAAYGGNN